MSQTLREMQMLIAAGDVEVSDHGDNKLAAERLSLRDLIGSIQYAIVVEDYPNYAKGPCVLVLQRNALDEPVHALWGIRKNTERPAVLITVYRPDPSRWSSDFLRRRT
jgi:hypothetical protein